MIKIQNSIIKKSKRRSAAVLGSPGNFGKEIVKSLLDSDDWDSIVLINRLELTDITIVNYPNYKEKVKEYVVEMDNVDRFENCCMGILSMEQCNALFIAMGVGADHAVNGNLIRYSYIDLPVAFARGAKEGTSSVKHVSILTGIGSDKHSIPYTHDQFGLVPSIISKENLYNHIKSKVVESLIELKFPSLSIFRPTTLIGNPVSPKIISDSMVIDAYNMMLGDRNKIKVERTCSPVHWNGTEREKRGSKLMAMGHGNIDLYPFLRTSEYYFDQEANQRKTIITIKT